MKVRPPLNRFPLALQRYILHFEASIEDAVREFAASLPSGGRVLDAGAGEGQYAHHFLGRRYVGVDLGIGDSTWSYSGLNAIADLIFLPFAEKTFDAALNVVTLEHVTDPFAVMDEIYRCLQPGGRLLLITPMDWEEHQEPHDYFRYTSYGLKHLAARAGFVDVEVRAVGGIFRLLSRRLLSAGQMVPLLLPFFAPIALVLPMLDTLDRKRNFTLGHICYARRP